MTDGKWDGRIGLDGLILQDAKLKQAVANWLLFSYALRIRSARNPLRFEISVALAHVFLPIAVYFS